LVLRLSPPEVRRNPLIHDFVMLHPLAGTNAARAATAQGAAFLRDALHGNQHDSVARGVPEHRRATNMPAALATTGQEPHRAPLRLPR
jgi:hypothetical protein